MDFTLQIMLAHNVLFLSSVNEMEWVPSAEMLELYVTNSFFSTYIGRLKFRVSDVEGSLKKSEKIWRKVKKKLDIPAALRAAL